MQDREGDNEFTGRVSWHDILGSGSVIQDSCDIVDSDYSEVV